MISTKAREATEITGAELSSFLPRKRRGPFWPDDESTRPSFRRCEDVENDRIAKWKLQQIEDEVRDFVEDSEQEGVRSLSQEIATHRLMLPLLTPSLGRSSIRFGISYSPLEDWVETSYRVPGKRALYISYRNNQIVRVAHYGIGLHGEIKTLTEINL